MSSSAPDRRAILFPDQTLLSTRHFIVAQDWEVPIPGFFVIASRAKVRTIIELSDPAVLELASLQKTLRTAMRDLLGITDVYFFQNEDSVHGFHLWVFPRHDWMERFGRKIQSVRRIMDYAVHDMTTPENLELVRQTANRMKDHLEMQGLSFTAKGKRKPHRHGEAGLQDTEIQPRLI